MLSRFAIKTRSQSRSDGRSSRAKRRLHRTPFESIAGRCAFRPQFEQLEPRIVLSFNPTGMEQELFQLVNRFRTDPQGELTRLVDSLDPISSPYEHIDQQLQYWKVDGAVLAEQWEALNPVPPLAWSEAAYEAAHVHNLEMIEHDAQEHEFPGEGDAGDRLHDAGYAWRRWGENIYAYPRSNSEIHGGFVIDWGATPTGIQDPPGHRDRLMQANYVHLGLGITEVASDAGTSVGPLVVTQVMATPLATGDAYVVGAVFEQLDDAPYYFDGQGYGNVEIVFEGTGGVFQATSMSAGGYQIQLPAGTYRGIASGGSLPGLLASDEFVIGASNVAIDFKYPADQVVPPSAKIDIVATHLNTAVTIDVVANDRAFDGTIDPNTVTLVVPPTHGTVSLSSQQAGVLQYTPHDDFFGIDEFSYRVKDSAGIWTNTAPVRLLVLDFNDHPWHNPWLASDVNGDGLVSPIDALLVIGDLNSTGSRLLTAPPEVDTVPPPFFDVSGDNQASPLDALFVIDRLNRGDAAEGELDGEGEFSALADLPQSSRSQDTPRPSLFLAPIHTNTVWGHAGRTSWNGAAERIDGSELLPEPTWDGLTDWTSRVVPTTERAMQPPLSSQRPVGRSQPLQDYLMATDAMFTPWPLACEEALGMRRGTDAIAAMPSCSDASTDVQPITDSHPQEHPHR